MPQPRRVALLLAVLALAPAACVLETRAADLDGPRRHLPPGGLPPVPPVVLPPPPLGVLDDPAIVVEQPILRPRLPPPPPVGGAFVYAPGLNGPLGPPAYPLLPFAFGYGY